MSEERLVTDLVGRLGRITHGLQYAGGLNPAQWEALRFLDRANKYSRSPTALAEFLGVTKGTASQTLIALESKGYIKRRRCPEDRRCVEIELTEAGQGLLANDPLAQIACATEHLPSEVACSLRQGMELLIRALAQAQGLTEFGPCGACNHLRADGDAEREETRCRCALTGDLLDCTHRAKLCVDFSPTV